MFISCLNFKVWSDYFSAQQLKVMDFPYPAFYKKFTVQRRAGVYFPQILYDLALIAKSLGLNPDGFKPELRDKVTTLVLERTSRYASSINANECKIQLTNSKSKAPICREEKNMNLLMYVMDMFAPPQVCNGSFRWIL